MLVSNVSRPMLDVYTVMMVMFKNVRKIFSSCLKNHFTYIQNFCSYTFFSPTLILINFIIHCVIFTSLIIDWLCNVYLCKLSIVVHYLGNARPYTCGLKSRFDFFFFFSDYSKVLSTHPTNVILYSSICLFLNMVVILTFSNVVLTSY